MICQEIDKIKRVSKLINDISKKSEIIKYAEENNL